MLSEGLLLVLLMIISSQSSSLWTSLSIIPTSILLIMTCHSINFFSSIIMIIYIMVFIGGLMVLLVSVASISYQEQSFYFLKSWVFFLAVSLMPLLSFYKMETLVSSNQFSSWYESTSVLLWISIFIMTVALLILTKLILNFKGMIRSL